MARALEYAGVRPIIDKVRPGRDSQHSALALSGLQAAKVICVSTDNFQVFDFADIKAAYQYMADGKHFGKVGVQL